MLTNTLQALFVAIAALLAAQTLALVAFVLAFRKWSTRMAGLAEDAARDIQPVLQATRELLVNSTEQLDLVFHNLVEISQLSRQHVTRQIIRLDQVVSNAGLAWRKPRRRSGARYWSPFGKSQLSWWESVLP